MNTDSVLGNDREQVGMDFYKSIIESSPDGYAYHKIVVDEKNIPCNYVFIEVNNAFERFTGLKRLDILGKEITEISYNIKDSELKRIEILGNIAMNGGSEEFEQFIEYSNSWYKIKVYSPQKYFFVTHFTKIVLGKNQFEERLRESEENFKNFFETMDEMIFIGNINGKIFYTNDAVSKKLGYTKEELQGISMLDVHPIEKRDEAEQIFEDMFAGRRSSCPLPLVKKDGELIPVETRVWFGKWNGEDCIFGISKDLSIEQAAFDKFHKLFDNNPTLMAVSDISDKKFVEVNAAFLEKLGYSREEIIGKTSQEINLFLDDDKQIEVANKLQNEGRIKNIELNIRKKDGQIIAGLFSGEIIDNQMEKALLTVMTDITERKQTEEEIAGISERLKLATKAANLGIWEYNIVTGELIWDDEMYALYGISKETFSGAYEAWEHGLHPDDLEKSRQHINDAINGLREFNPIFRVLWKDGSVHHIKANAVVLHDAKGTPVRMYGTNWDVTEHIHYEEELLKAREQAEAANIAKGQFLANMSHEIRTPMNGIFGFLDLLQMSNLSSEQKEFIREAKSASTLLLNLINDILDFSKIEAGKLHMENISFNVRTAVEDAVSLLEPKAAEKNLKLHVLIKEDVPEEIMGDPSRLRQILSNLVSNAVKFTESGEVSITVDSVEKENDMAILKFDIKDTGIGISKEAIGDLFQSFNQADTTTTRKYGGTGLGLAITKELVKMMGGEISVSSILCEGSLFTFTIYSKIVKRAVVKNIDFENNSGKNILIADDNINIIKIVDKDVCKKARTAFKPEILLVEDSEMNRKIVIRILESHNLTCDVAINGLEACMAMQEKEYDIVFMDCQMPVMDGYESTSRIREHEGSNKHTTIIAMTANAMTGDKAKCIEAGMDDYISKPIDFEHMIRLIEANTKDKRPELGQFNLINDYIEVFMEKTGFRREEAIEMLEEYMIYLQEIFSDINFSIRRSDFEQIGKLAHQLKGSSANYRIESIYELAVELEKSSIYKEKKECEKIFEELQKLCY